MRNILKGPLLMALFLSVGPLQASLDAGPELWLTKGEHHTLSFQNFIGAEMGKLLAKKRKSSDTIFGTHLTCAKENSQLTPWSCQTTINQLATDFAPRILFNSILKRHPSRAKIRKQGHQLQVLFTGPAAKYLYHMQSESKFIHCQKAIKQVCCGLSINHAGEITSLPKDTWSTFSDLGQVCLSTSR